MEVDFGEVEGVVAVAAAAAAIDVMVIGCVLILTVETTISPGETVVISVEVPVRAEVVRIVCKYLKYKAEVFVDI